MNKKIHILLLFAWCLLTASAQNISVASFKMLENDLTANTYGTQERDHNGETAALIKVVTTEQGFVFDGGMVGIVKVKQGVGEVWVYVPHGIKRITVQHQQLGVLRDYYFPIPIEKARTYELVLATGKVETVVTHAVNKQFVLFNVTPANASVELGDEVLMVDDAGCAAKNVAFGTYSYRVSCANYHTAAGQVTVTAQGKAEVNVTLRPNFGWIQLDAAAEAYRGAYVYIDNERVGQLPLKTNELKSGAHKVKVVKNLFKPYETQVVVADGETAALNVSLVPNFANITLVADADGEIWIDGEKKGKGQWSGQLELGEYTIEVRKESHRSSSEILRVASVLDKTVQLKAPTPIYASLEVASNPLRATVLIDGKQVGETPLMKNDVLVGTHRIVFKKEGYGAVEKTVVVKEGEENHVSANLTSKKNADHAQATSTKSKGHGVPAAGEKEKKKKEEPRQSGFLVGVDAGYSTYGFNYGGEVGMQYKRVALSVGAKNYMMGNYTLCDNKTGDNAEDHPVQLLRFTAKVGYTLGDKVQATPQVGMVFGPSFFKGKEYVMNQLPMWDVVNTVKDKVLADRDYTAMNSNIMQFAAKRCGLLIGVRLGYTFDFGLGLHVTPEYVVGEGVAVSAGISMKF